MPIPNFFKTHQRLIITLASATFIILGTTIAIRFAKGYRPTRSGALQGTGLLAASSNPTGARILIDGESSNQVTNETINLKPGIYDIEITKEGFTTWKKTLKVEPELVTSTDAHLFRTVPSLAPLTFSGAENLTPSPDGQKIAFSIASASAQVKPGLYVIELSDRPNLFGNGTKHIAENPLGQSFSQANLLWSPDSSQILASFDNATYLLETNSLTKRINLIDTSTNLSLLFSTWEEEITTRDKQLLLRLPDEMINVATSSAKNIYFSPNGEKLLYTATAEITIPTNLIPSLPASNTQPESRTLNPSDTYIYDLKEDKNFLVLDHPDELPQPEFTKIKLITEVTETSIFNPADATASATPKLQDPKSLDQTIQNFQAQYSSIPFTDYQWFPTSKHLLLNKNGSVNIIEYDGTNLTTLYSGTYYRNFVYPWPNGSKLIILTNLTNNPALPPNLYSINLK